MRFGRDMLAGYAFPSLESRCNGYSCLHLSPSSPFPVLMLKRVITSIFLLLLLLSRKLTAKNRLFREEERGGKGR